MIRKISATPGKLEGAGKKEHFVALTGGEQFQVYIEFDNGSMLGYTTLEGLGEYVTKSVRQFDAIPDGNTY